VIKRNFILLLLSCVINSFLISSARAEGNLVMIGGSIATVSGDWKRFQEDNWMKRNATAGLEEFYLDKHFKDGKHLILETSGSTDTDYDLLLDLSKENFGYVHLSYDAFRKYYDDSGDYFEFPAGDGIPAFYELDKNLHTDRSNISLELALTLPEQPRYILSYDHMSRIGEMPLATRGMVTDTVPATDISQYTYPWSKDINWTTDTFKAGTEFTLKGINFALSQQYQIFSDDESGNNVYEMRDNAVLQRIETQNEPSSHTATTNFTADTKIKDTLQMKLGYALNKSSSRDQYRTRTYGSNGTITNTFDYYNGEANSDLGAQSVNWGMNLKILDDLTFRGALRYRTANISGSSEYIRDNKAVIPGSVLHNQNSDIEESNTGETVNLTYKGIPRTSIYAEASAEQSRVDYSIFGREYDETRSTNLNWENKTFYFKENYSLGINTRPIKQLFISARYKRKNRDNSYNSKVDNKERTQHQLSDPKSFQYPGYIGDNTQVTDEYSLRTNITLNKFISFGAKYQAANTSYDVMKESYTEIGSLDDHTTSASVTVTPTDKLYLNCVYSIEKMKLRTPSADANVAHTPTDQPFNGDSSSILGAVNYALNEKTTLSGQFQTWRSEADRSVSGMASIERELIKNILLKIGYSYYAYNEGYPTSFNDYKAHVGSVSITGKF